MCGICGIVDWTGNDRRAIVQSMLSSMHHRGPDDEGIFESERREANVAIGIRRLSIIDIEGGHQPMYNDDRSIAGVLNGEIYNFREVRTQLEDRGYKFRTRSDSEVVVKAYEEWGAASVERLEGMFAIAIVDERPEIKGQKPAVGGGTLFLARDRLGIKPLYYYIQRPTSNVQRRTSGPTGVDESVDSIIRASDPSELWTLDVGPWTTFLVASEVRTLLASGLVPRKLSREALESYLLFGSVSEPMTLIEGVMSLPPGHRVTIALADPENQIQPESYWNICQRTRPSKNGGEPAAEVRKLLEASVRKHLIADVPVGVFLSSGIDSTALAALASKEAAGVHTFTVAFPEKEFSEAEIARRTSSAFGTTHQEVMLSGDEMLERLGDAVSALDQPSIDGINTYFVSWGARQAGLKVTLSGLGGDEIFGGYSTFRRTATFQRMAAIGSAMPRAVRSTVAHAFAATGGHFVSIDAAQKLAGLWAGGSLPDAFFFGRALFTPAQVSKIIRAQKRNGSSPRWLKWLADTAAQANELDAFAAVTCMEARSYLVNTLLRDTDSMSMAHSLEVRVPFLDHPLVEMVTHLPQQLKLKKGQAKALLIEALRDVLPSEVVSQRKRGFTFPWAEWLRGPLKAKVERGLSELSPALSEVLDVNETANVWQNYLEGKSSWSRPWSLFVLNEWTKTNLE